MWLCILGGTPPPLRQGAVTAPVFATLSMATCRLVWSFFCDHFCQGWNVVSYESRGGEFLENNAFVICDRYVKENICICYRCHLLAYLAFTNVRRLQMLSYIRHWQKKRGLLSPHSQWWKQFVMGYTTCNINRQAAQWQTGGQWSAAQHSCSWLQLNFLCIILYGRLSQVNLYTCCTTTLAI